MKEIQDLKALVGTKYEETDINGNYLNCFSPIYLIYPNAPKFKKPKSNKCFDYAFLKVQKYCIKIEKEKMQPLDIIVFYKVFRAMHIGIYLGEDLILHGALDKKYQIIRLSKYYDFIKGVFRYNEKK